MKYLLTLFVFASFFLLTGCQTDMSPGTINRSDNGSDYASDSNEVDDTGESIIVSESFQEHDTISFNLTGKSFSFMMGGVSNPELRVKKGDVVRIDFSSTEGLHSFALDEFFIASEQVRPEDGVTSVMFVVDRVGTFEYYCNVGNHRAQGMKGTL